LRCCYLASLPSTISVRRTVTPGVKLQTEVYFSIVQRKVLNPNDFSSPAALKGDLIRFQQRYEKSARPFEWTFTRRDLHELLANLSAKSDRLVA
jgi:hypothetical protein